MKFIKSKENPLIKRIRTLIKEKERERVFLLESKKLVEEALSSNLNIAYILITEKFFNENRRFLKILEGYEIFIVTEKIERVLSTLETPSGIFALASLKNQDKPSLQPDSTVLILYEIKDPGNLGTIFRSAEIFGVERIYLTPNSCSPFNTKVVRASAGSCFRVRFFENIEIKDVFKEIRSHKGKIFATSPREGIPPWKIKWEGLCCLIVGSEPMGIPENIQSLSDMVISIPQMKGESMNVAISTSIILYEIAKNRFL